MSSRAWSCCHQLIRLSEGHADRVHRTDFPLARSMGFQERPASQARPTRSNCSTSPKISLETKALPRLIIRDRFEGAAARELTAGELAGWGAVAEVSARAPSSSIGHADRGVAFLLGVSTDVAGAKAQDEARQFSQAVFEQTDLDGISTSG